MAEAAATTISVLCKCGKKLKAPATAVGRKAKCPNCGNVITVAPPPPLPQDDSLDALYDLAAESEQAQQQQLSPRCPNCMREMSAGAVLCTNCGYDTRSGRSVGGSPAAVAGTRFDPAAAAAAEAEAKKRKNTGPVDKLAPQGPLWKGLVFSGGGAAIGAVVWILIAYATGYWGMLPVFLVAVLAGLGMQRGQEGYSYLGGFLAAAITFAVMILARLAVIVALVVPSMISDARRELARAEAERMPDLSMYDERVVDQFFEEESRKHQPAPAAEALANEDEDLDEEEVEKALDAEELREIAIYQAVEKKLQAMPKAQYDAMVKKFDDQEKAERLDDLVTEDILLMVIRVHPDRATSVEYSQAQRAAKEKIAGMTPAQRDAEYARLTKKEAEEEAKAEAEAERERAAHRAARGKAGEDADRAVAHAAVAIGAAAIFLMTFGGIGGVILMVLALGLAYRTASGSIGD